MKMGETVTAEADDYIPGTDYLFKPSSSSDGAVLTDGDAILVPQPTVSPNDPLRWSLLRKCWHLALILFLTGLTAATSNSAGAAEDGIQEDYNIDVNVFATGTGVLFIGIGWWTWFAAPAVSLWGSRSNYIVSAVLSIIGNIWYARVKDSSDVVWSQLFIGASESVTEAVVQLSITQIFYQKSANHMIGLYVLSISVGTFVGPLVGGFIADYLNWHWVGYMAVIISGAALIVIVFGLEETSFDRKHWAPLLVALDSGIPSSQENTSSDVPPVYTHESMEKVPSGRVGSVGDEIGDIELQAQRTMATIRPDVVNEPKQTIPDEPNSYWQQMRFITPANNLKGWGFKQYLQRLLLMTRVFLFPAVLFSGLQWGAQDAWLSFYIDLEDDFYYDPPFNYTDAMVGIMNIPTLIGAVIGCVYGGWFSEWFTDVLARRNGGVREAEMRLWCIIPAGLVSPVGMILLGVGTERAWKWYAPYVGLGLIGFGWGCCGDLAMSYLVDCYPEMVLEGMVGVSMINNNIGMVFSFVTDRWMASSGAQNTFIAIAVLNFFFVMLTFPMIYWGKKCRIWTRSMYFDFIERRDGLDS